ncbi:hypothetical protein [Paenibacillus piri]|uniref:hypothetical protein n=1 Tax=Paenibacillus piri TaxID=2547395 RepID=UPI001404A6A5|nr:hypothetical protein [Paenibacillus piri]
METAKMTEKDKQFAGLGWIMIIAGILLFAPFAYFLINFMLGNENPVYIMMK